MKILLLAAMDKEIDLLKNILSDLEEIELREDKLFKGKIKDHDIIIAKCGIGKVNAALNCQRFIDSFNPDIIINSGVAGGAALPIGSVLVADKITYNDVWCGPGTDYGQADGFPLYMVPSSKIIELSKTLDSNLKFGLICTGDKFITTPQEIDFIKSHFPEVKAVDMESAAIAQTALLNHKEFAIIRVVSDTPGSGENISQYKDFWKIAPEKTFNFLEILINAL